MKNNYVNFIENIKRGNFVLPYCRRCKKNIWPPSDNCRLCLGKLSLENCNNKIGKILEIFVSKMMNNNIDNKLMILVDIDEVILLGSLSVDREKQEKDSLKGNLVRIKKCGFIDNKIFYEFEILNKFN
ncbi:MAG TPA: hypothetical protein VFP49_12415 [Nitrososphaeraceae archaeon]|jgi:uncharacterized OB-fold protein|nr:hypothetical protein [Nitrososphaeraceae archaeon]